MASVEGAARAGARSARPRSRPAGRGRVASGVVWISVVAVLLAGVVALNVAVLRLNLQLDDTGRERAKLRAENAALASQLSSEAAAPRIEALARGRLGLVPAQESETTYLQLRRPRR